MPLNMKCNITIDYTIAVVPDVNEFNRFSKTKLMLLFLSSSFCKFFLDQLYTVLDFKSKGCFKKSIIIFFPFFFEHFFLDVSFLLFFVVASRGRFFHVDV